MAMRPRFSNVITHAFPKKIEPDYRNADGDCRPDQRPDRLVDCLLTIPHQQAPVSLRRLCAQPKIA